MSLFPEPKAAPPLPRNAADEAGKPIIHTARWVDEGHTAIWLTVTLPNSIEEEQEYCLNGTDQFGNSPELRAELERMVDEEGFVIGDFVADPEPEPSSEPV